MKHNSVQKPGCCDDVATPLGQLASHETSRRGGAALIIVLGMTGMLMFLGFFFFSYISTEHNSAAWFSLSADGQIQESDYFDFALQQILIGPPDDLRNSALYGRKYSLIPNMLGSFGPDLKPNDLHLYSGRGINVRYQGDDSAAGLPTSTNYFFDYGATGVTPDYTATGSRNRIMNFSPATNPVGANNVPFSPLGQQRHPDFIADFEPDAGYTYPDINSMFLGYFSLVDINPDPSITELKKVWIPSFHRPQYLPRDPTVDLFRDSTFRNRVLRPHEDSFVRLRRFDGTAVESLPSLRYVAAGGFNTTYTGEVGPVNGFPFPNFVGTPTTSADEYRSGIWTEGTAIDETTYTINYDVDADGLGANGNEAILTDLDHRAEILPDGRKRIPIFAITIMDADGLLNLNATGNLFGEANSLAHSRTVGSPVVNPAAFGDGRFITKSNLGLSPGELNLGRALYKPLPGAGGGLTQPPAAMTYDEMFRYNGSIASTQVTQTDMANMEVARMLIGLADGDTSDDTEVVAGRWGEASLIDQAVASSSLPQPPRPRVDWNPTSPFPAPGGYAVDDNNNYATGGGKALRAGQLTEDPIFGPLGLDIPPVVHPIDPSGVAVNYFAVGNQYSNTFASEEATETFVPTDALYGTLTGNNTFGKLRASQQPGMVDNNPSRWPSYSNRYELQANAADLINLQDRTGVSPWYQATTAVGTLQANNAPSGSPNLFLADEPDEILIEPAFRNHDADALFSNGEMQFLHLNDNDWNNVSATSRLEQLARFNFLRADFNPVTNYRDDWWLRSQFTTDSFDRWEFGFSPAVGSVPGDLTTPRGFEFTPLQGDPQRLVFPPEFARADRFTPTDPFRRALRQWLTIELNRDEQFPNFPLPQRRLNLNRFLDQDERGEFVERHLTPHPVFLATETDSEGILDRCYEANSSVVQLYSSWQPGFRAVPGNLSFNRMQNNKFVQEWWAKYDRQRMARDIYVLLYTLGGPSTDASGNPIDYANQPSSVVYPVTPGVTDNEDTNGDGNPDGDGINDHLQQMAQFAVNYVDALDRDSVITEFVFDTDLSDGWEIDGEKNLTTGEFTDTTNETASVFGVEAQQLTFSETLWTALQNTQMNDSDLTPWDDATTSDIQFLFVELRNASPFPSEYGDGTWRLRRVVNEDDFVTGATDDIVASFRNNGNITEIEAGANFWIGTHNINDDSLPAAIIAHADGDTMEYTPSDVFCPSRQLQDPMNPTPICDLDLCHADHDLFYRSPGSVDPGYFLSENAVVAAAGETITLVLERRLNQRGAGALDNDAANPWVPVDYMQAEMTNGPVDIFDDPDTATAVEIGELENITSFERIQPFLRGPNAMPNDEGTLPHPAETNGRSHSFGPDNPAPFNDPIYDPYVESNEATDEINGAKTFTLWQPHFDRDFVSVMELLSLPLVGPQELTDRIAEGEKLSGLNTAYTKFANPNPNPDVNIVDDNNLWYRLLELVEIPTSVQSAVKDDLPIPRTPARINLNTIRHPGVLAALIDDDFHLRPFRDPATVNSDSDVAKSVYPYLQLRDPKEATRHWFEQFMFSRDRIDPVTNIALPGIPGSRPFRPFSYLDVTANNTNAEATVEHTLLRSLPYNGTGSTANPMAENTNPQGVYGSEWSDPTSGSAPPDALVGTQNVINRRGLFEARTINDVGGTFPPGAPEDGVDAVDYHTRQRLLNKIANNSTVRSHVFYCWIHVQFHEAAEDEFGNVQVGGKLTDAANAEQRAFFVLDRSKLEEAWDPRSGSFDWRRFVVLRHKL